MKRPRLIPSYYIRLEVGAGGCEDSIFFTSGRREIRLAGKSFSRFVSRVVPLLDGKHELETILNDVSPHLPADEVRAAIALLGEQRLIEDAALDLLDENTRTRFAAQLHWFHEMGLQAQAVQRVLEEATVVVIGDSGPARALEASGVGTVRLAPAQCDVPRTIEGANFVIAAIDAGMSSALYQINRACLDSFTPWTSAMVWGHEGWLGPTVIPRRTACYVCYKMRSVACANDPAAAFAFEKFLDDRRRDDSAVRESVPAFHTMLGEMMALEAIKWLAAMEPSAEGMLAVMNFLTLETSRHLVLRKPECPACGH